MSASLPLVLPSSVMIVIVVVVVVVVALPVRIECTSCVTTSRVLKVLQSLRVLAVDVGEDSDETGCALPSSDVLLSSVSITS